MSNFCKIASFSPAAVITTVILSSLSGTIFSAQQFIAIPLHPVAVPGSRAFQYRRLWTSMCIGRSRILLGRILATVV